MHHKVLKKGTVIFAHGSRIEAANEAVRLFARSVAQAGALPDVEPAFLELGEPDLEGAVARLAACGVDRILVVPYFLTLGTHLQRDLPAIVERAAAIHTGVKIRVTPPLDGHPALIRVVLDRTCDALERWE